jgi:1,4-alpha-glucan branching enzyme
VAQSRVHEHASHFAGTLHDTAASQQKDAVVVAPFDAELFGHWWFEGVDFVSTLYRMLKGNGVRPMTASEYVTTHPPRASVTLAEGSWGKDGNFSMWLNDRTAWTWGRLWLLEDAFWSVARAALQGGPDRRAVLEAAARSLLLAQASDWQFIMSTGAAADYADERFREHAAEGDELVAALQAGGAIDERVMARVAELRTRNAVFPNVLDTVEQVLA